MSHPSFFALDAWGLDPRAGDVATHVRACPQCQAHVAAMRMPAPFPPALAALQAPPPKFARWRWLALGLATAALLFTVVTLTVREPPPAITAKGSPGVVLWLNRNGKVIAWNGQPVIAGDAVRLEVAPAGLTRITVFDEQARQVLYEAEVPDGAPTLTPAWAFDGQSPTESLRVVLSRKPVSLDALSAPDCTTDADAHCTRFMLHRESR